jgi:hypothetical protein
MDLWRDIPDQNHRKFPAFLFFIHSSFLWLFEYASLIIYSGSLYLKRSLSSKIILCFTPAYYLGLNSNVTFSEISSILPKSLICHLLPSILLIWFIFCITFSLSKIHYLYLFILYYWYSSSPHISCIGTRTECVFRD